jgi:hypothetical protein
MKANPMMAELTRSLDALTGSNSAVKAAFPLGIDATQIAAVANPLMEELTRSIQSISGPTSSILGKVASGIDMSMLFNEVVGGLNLGEIDSLLATGGGSLQLIGHGAMQSLLGQFNQVPDVDIDESIGTQSDADADRSAEGHGSLSDVDLESAINVLALAILFKFVLLPIIFTMGVVAGEKTLDMTTALYEFTLKLQEHSAILQEMEFWAFIFGVGAASFRGLKTAKKKLEDHPE